MRRPMQMDQNPYAPPGEYLRLPNEPPGLGAPQHWETGEVLREGFEATKKRWPTLVSAVLVELVASNLPDYTAEGLTALGLVVEDSVAETVASGAGTAISLMLSAFLTVGFTRMCLAAAR